MPLELMDDQELQDHLRDLVSEDGQVDMPELQIIAHNGVVYIEGALPSEAEHAILLNILTDVAGVQEIVVIWRSNGSLGSVRIAGKKKRLRMSCRGRFRIKNRMAAPTMLCWRMRKA
ncbi:MAG TPA: BON domain-containing protein [Candidatus Binatia bacterium]